MISPRLRGPFSVAMASLCRSFVLASRMPDDSQRLLGLGVGLPLLRWRTPQQLPRMRQSAAVSPHPWPKLRVPRVQAVKAEPVKGAQIRDAQEMQEMPDLHGIPVSDVQQEQQVEEVLVVTTVVSEAPPVSGAAPCDVIGTGELNGVVQEFQELPKLQDELSRDLPEDLPVARVGSAVKAQPVELRAVRKCLLAAAREAWPQMKFSWRSLIKFDARLFNPHWQARLVVDFRTEGSQLFTEVLTEMFTEDLFFEELQKLETH